MMALGFYGHEELPGSYAIVGRAAGLLSGLDGLRSAVLSKVAGQADAVRANGFLLERVRPAADTETGDRWYVFVGQLIRTG